MVFGNNVSIALLDAWYHGFDYNATPGSRAQITTVLKPGFFLCTDPEAYADDATYQASGSGSSVLPTGADYGPMTLHPEPLTVGTGDCKDRKLARAVTRPATAVLNLCFGVIVDIENPRAWGSQSLGAGPHRVRCAVSGETVLARLNGSFTYGDPIMLSNGSFYGVPVSYTLAAANTTGGIDTAIGYGLAANRKIVGYALETGTFDGTTLTRIRLGSNWGLGF